ncbi:hypothetical protein OA90_07825 [Labrenzia sp. OB1]|nr:hypothetical protein OA90_07825 [Labrenzia sp. OB1]
MSLFNRLKYDVLHQLFNLDIELNGDIFAMFDLSGKPKENAFEAQVSWRAAGAKPRMKEPIPGIEQARPGRRRVSNRQIMACGWSES